MRHVMFVHLSLAGLTRISNNTLTLSFLFAAIVMSLICIQLLLGLAP